MKNSIIEEYRLWLKNYQLQDRKQLQKPVIDKLFDALAGLNSITEVRDLFAIYATREKQGEYPFFSENELACQLISWDSQLEKTLDLEKSARQKLTNVEYPVRIKPLIDFIDQLLALPATLLHLRANSLLSN